MKVLAAAFLVVVALSATGAAAQRSSSPSGEDLDPQWSSDGSRIAFVRRESTGFSTIYTMASGGGDERRLISLGHDYFTWMDHPPLLSPNWRNVALISPASTLKVESVDGADVHELGERVGSFAWSPDSRRVAFHETDLGNNSRIFVVESDGSGLRDLGPGQSPAWSPGSDRIAFVAPNGKLYVMNADGSDRSLVYDGNGVMAYAPSWSPLGDRIAFYAASRISIVMTDGRPVLDIPSDYPAPAKWSRDGSLIAIENPNQFSVLELDTGQHWTFQDRRNPSWSPVADELTASYGGRCKRSGIYRMSLPVTSRRLTLDCHILGTGRPDVLTGTSYTDIVRGLEGDDELLGGDGEDSLFGGPGDDTLLGGPMGDRLEGGYGADLLVAGFEGDLYGVSDLLLGGPGPDDLRSGPGSDSLSGSTGNDVLRGGAGSDTLLGGPGRDRIFASGDPSDDYNRVVRDSVNCGNGRHDTAYVDRKDIVSNCETVHRR